MSDMKIDRSIGNHSRVVQDDFQLGPVGEVHAMTMMKDSLTGPLITRVYIRCTYGNDVK
jgi:hypothetical protein